MKHLPRLCNLSVNYHYIVDCCLILNLCIVSWCPHCKCKSIILLSSIIVSAMYLSIIWTWNEVEHGSWQTSLAQELEMWPQQIGIGWRLHWHCNEKIRGFWQHTAVSMVGIWLNIIALGEDMFENARIPTLNPTSAYGKMFTCELCLTVDGISLRYLFPVWWS